MAAPISTTVTGTVRAVNDRGVKLDPYGEWFNLSKWAEGVVLPERGEHVTLALDKAGFVRAVERADGQRATNGVTAPSGAAQKLSAPSGSADRERTIARLAILKAAAEFGAARPDLKSGDVLKIAELWERWTFRPTDSLDLEEAF